MNAQDIEIALAGWYDYRQNVIVPNVGSGVVYHECDMLVLTPSGYLTEIEIKVTKADLKADFKKKHGHRTTSNVKQFFYCYPALMKDCDKLIPASAGIIHIDEVVPYYLSDSTGNKIKILRPRLVRQAKINKGVQPLSDKDRMSLMRLGCMRIWSLKRKLSEVRHNRINESKVKK